MKVSLFYFILSSISNFSLSVYYIIIIKVVLQSWKSWNVALKIICQARVNKHTPNNSRKREKKTRQHCTFFNNYMRWLVYFFSGACFSFFFLLSFLSIFFQTVTWCFCNLVFAFILLAIFRLLQCLGLQPFGGVDPFFSHSCGFECRRHNSTWATPARWMKALVINWIWAPTYFRAVAYLYREIQCMFP
jgi:hypothetical protein